MGRNYKTNLDLTFLRSPVFQELIIDRNLINKPPAPKESEFYLLIFGNRGHDF
jgi:hypothetical protein